MPLKPLRPCAYPGCPALVNHGRCEEHRKSVKAAPAQKKTPKKVYKTAAWQKLRALFLRENPFCNRCGKIANTVHHKKEIEKGGRVLDIRNLEALCRSCHCKHHGYYRKDEK